MGDSKLPRGAALLGSFFVLTFALTWTLWTLCARYREQFLFAIGGPVFLLGVFAPGIVALALTFIREGRAGVARLVAPIGRWQASAGLYAFAVLYLAGTKLTAAVIQRLVIGTWPPFGAEPVVLMFLVIPLMMWTQAGEEIGWRGYALPRLAGFLGLGAAGLVLGIIWAVWHLPLFFIPGTGSDGQSLVLYTAHVSALSVALTWLYWKTNRSLFMVMLMHSAVNNTTGIVRAATPGATDVWSLGASFVGWTTAALGWAIALVLLWQMRGAELHDPSRHEQSSAPPRAELGVP
jgi:membrane protease YdiL (CAAX protease family)